jgi:8-oxo-dGTP diphosphatase
VTDFVILRHAHAGEKRKWRVDDARRPLSPQGISQADAFAAGVRDLRVSRILTSPTLRCEQTVKPLAASRGLPVEFVPELAPTASVKALRELMEAPEIDGAILCTHGEMITALSATWEEDGYLGLPPPGSHTHKGGGWFIRGYPGTDATAAYLPPENGAPPRARRRG